MTPVWTNWAREQRCAPVEIVRPGSEEEVLAALASARARGLRARCAGSGHSFTDCACTDGVLLDIGAMDRVLEADSESGLVRVQAGITINALGRELAERGLAMENQGDIDKQTLAGSTATGTHGTGLRYPNLSARIRSMRIATGTGEIVEAAADSDAALWRAARISLGALGVVTEITLETVPLFTVRRVDEPLPLGETLDRLDEHVEGNDHFEFYAFPYGEVAICRFSERTDEPPRPADPRREYVQEVLVENKVVEALARIGRRFPGQVPRLNRLMNRLVTRSVKTDLSHRVYASRREVRFSEMEYAVPRAAGRELIEGVLDLVPRRRLPVSFPIEVRFVAGDDALLSPTGGEETCYVAVHMFTGMEFESYFRGVEAIARSLGGRPHWGKRHYRAVADLAPAYPGWEEFQAQRAGLDPDGLFANDYTDRVLGPAGAG